MMRSFAPRSVPVLVNLYESNCAVYEQVATRCHFFASYWQCVCFSVCRGGRCPRPSPWQMLNSAFLCAAAALNGEPRRFRPKTHERIFFSQTKHFTTVVAFFGFGFDELVV